MKRPDPARKRQALHMLQQGQLNKAGAILDKLYRKGQYDAHSLFLRGTIKAQQGNRPRAIHLLRQSIQLQAGNPQAHLNLANAFR